MRTPCVAGRDMIGPVNVNMAAEQLLRELEAKVEGDQSLPPEEKKSLLQKIQDLATSPKVVEYITAIVKGWLGG
jgi:hypothetical protein